ncbi:MAG: OsmC family protein [Flammeovirgaceae bacterium]
MEITLNRLNDDVHFEAVNEDGISMHLDGSPEIGGVDGGVRPMQAVLMALAGCSGIDVVTLLKKMRQPLEDIQIKVKADRVDTIPRVFSAIHVHYILKGGMESDKVEKAVSLSMEKYCSVSKMIEKAAKITYSWEMQ